MQIVVFKLSNEYFAVDTSKVQSINDLMKVTKVPKAPKYIKGLINLRGSIKSLIDLNLLLNIEPSNYQENVIILSVNDEDIGVSVDRVEEVLTIKKEEIKHLEENEGEEYIEGIVNYENKLLTIINIDKLIG